MKKLGLCIGINAYAGNELQECVADMLSWSTVLVNAGFIVRQLRDRLATGKNIRDQIGYLMDMAIKGDSIFIQYSGHGTQVPDRNGDEADHMDEALCPVDIFTNGPLLDDELWSIFKRKRSGVQLIMASDSCHSGTVVRTFEMPSKGKKRFLHWRKFMELGESFDAAIKMEDAPEDKSLWPVGLMAGCMDNEYSYDAPELKNGAFTSYALKALKQIGPSATYDEWFTAIRKYLPNKDYPQSPNWVGSFGGKKVLS